MNKRPIVNILAFTLLSVLLSFSSIAKSVDLKQIYNQETETGQARSFQVANGGLQCTPSPNPTNNGGVVSISPSGVVTYTPRSGFAGLDFFIVTCGAAIHSVNMKVKPRVLVPSITTSPGVTGSGQFAIDPQNSEFFVSYRVVGWQRKPATVSAAGLVQYTPDAGFIGTDRADIEVSVRQDGQYVILDDFQVNIEVTNAPPPGPTADAPPISVAVNEIGYSQISVSGTQPSDTITFQVSSDPQNGDAEVDGGGLVSYTPDQGFQGTDQVVVLITIQGSRNTTISVTIPVTVGNTSSNPNASAPPIYTTMNTAGTSQVAVTGLGQGSVVSYAVTTNGAHGTATVSPTGLVSYQPISGYSGNDSIIVRARVSGGTAVDLFVTIPVQIANDSTPSASASAIYIVQGDSGESQIQVSNSSSGDQKTFSIPAQPANGSASVSTEGLVRYTPNSGFSGSDEIGVSLVITGQKPANLTVAIPVKVEKSPVNPPGYEFPCEVFSRNSLKASQKRRMLDDAGQVCGSKPVISIDGSSLNDQCPDQKCVGDPINIATGAMWHKTEDFFVPGRTPLTYLALRRVYVTQAAGPIGDFGPNWRHNWETRLLPVAGEEDIVWIDEEGGPWYFLKEGSNFSSPAGLAATLTDAGSHYELKKQDLTVLFFDKNSGMLQKLREPHGEEVVLAYAGGKLASISTPLAGTLTFTRNVSGRITGVTRARDGLSYTYGYDASGRLSSFTDFGNLKQEYAYVANMPGTYAQGMMASMKDEIGRVTRFEYFADGSVKRQIEAGGAALSLSYTAEPSTTVQDIDGTTTTYHFDSNYRVVAVDNVDGSRTYTEWSAGGYVKSITNELGHVFRYGYDPQGNMTKVQGPEDSSPAIASYDQVFNIPLSYSPQSGARTEFVIDGQKGDILEMRRLGSAETLRLNFGLDAFGNILSVNNGRASYSHERNTDGLLTKLFDTRNPETRSYDARARLITRSFASGRTIQYSYDDYDRITSAVDSHGPDLSVVYDGVGRTLSRTVTDGITKQVTTFTWDAYDRITSVKNPKNEVTKFVYDQTRILDLPSAVVDPMGKSTTFQFDARGRLISTTDAKGNATAYGYDAVGQLTSVTDALGNVTSFEYDGNGRKVKETRASVMGTGSSNLAVNSVTNFSYDAAGRLIKEEKVSASGGDAQTVEYQYDEFDRLSRLIQKKGGQIEDEAVYSYESQLDLTLLKSAVNGTANLSFSHEAAPPFAGTGFGIAAAVSGNPLGLLEKEFSTVPSTTGELTSIQDEAGAVLFTKAYDPAGRLVGVKASGYKTGISYDGFGRRAKLAHSDGSTQTIQYDLLNRVKNLAWRTKAGPIEEHLNYDASGNVFELSRENARYDLEYDALNQLQNIRAAMTGGEAYTRKFEYDALGNRLRDTLRGKGRFLANFLEGDGLSKFLADEDGLGRVAAEQTGQMVKRFSYRPDGKISQFQSGDASATYHYDALGRLVAVVALKNGEESKESFVHLAEENRFLLSKSADGKVTTQIDGQGVAERLGEVSGNSGKGYITDHQGSVLNSSLTAGSNAYGLFGETTANPTLSPTSSPVMYGWQGLNYDAATGQWDNLARQYDQKTGRFTSQDPSGLQGGINLYGSRRNNPLKYADHNGENPVLVIGGAIVGGAAAQGLTSFATTYYVTGNFDQAVQAGKSGAIAGGLAGFLAVAGGASALAVGAAVVVDVGYSLLTGPFSLEDPRDFNNGLKYLTNQKNVCP